MTENNNSRGASCHIFIFPFKWDFCPDNKPLENIPLNARISLNSFDNSLDKAQWKRIPFALEEPANYNEYTYFYDFVRDALFDPGHNPSKILHRYRYELNTGSMYTIHVKNKPMTLYDLDIEDIFLTAYTTGVGILSFHLCNRQYPDRSDVLKINEFGRRIYPQFLDNSNFTAGTKQKFLADRLIIKRSGQDPLIEDFSHFNRMQQVRENPSRLPGIITGLLGESFVTREKEAQKDRILISPVIDDRMYTICWYADNALCKKLAKYDKKNREYAYISNDDWFKFVFIDPEAPCCKSIPMKKQLAQTHTYDRWIGKGSEYALYGFTRYSFVLLTTRESSYYAEHMKTMYFQMARLALVQRASVLRFSGEAAQVSADMETKDTTGIIRTLNRHYLWFVNKIYFREVTAQEQGIDIYNHLAGSMEIERDVKDLDHEIDELHKYASLLEDKKNNEQLHTLTVLGALFLIPTFIASYFGMNILNRDLQAENPSKFVVICSSLMVIAIFSWSWIKLRNRPGGKEKAVKYHKILLLLLILLLVLVMMFPLVGADFPVLF